LSASIILAFCSPLPNNYITNGNEDALVCDNLPKFSVELDAGIQDGTYNNNTLCLEKSWGFLPGKITHWLYLKKVYTVKNQFIGLQQSGP
jgi:hypothetical protein